MDIHPFAEHFPLLQGAEKEAFKESIAKTKGNEVHIDYRMVKGKKELLDGRNRLVACEELGIKPKMRLVNVKDAEVMDYILRRNILRRHLDAESRKVIVADLRADGKSTRDIAARLGVSQTTIQKDLSGEQNCSDDAKNTEEMPRITGRDGKSHPARKPLCDRCKRVGPTKNCPMCAELRNTGKKREPRPQAVPKDNHGTELPKKCRDAFCDPWLPETIEYLRDTLDEFLTLRLADGMDKRKGHYPFFKAKDIADGVGFVQQYLEQLLNHLEEFRPDAVCPKCQGEGCTKCKQSGLVHEKLYEELTNV